MKRIDIEEILNNRMPSTLKRLGKLQTPFINLVKKLLHANDINYILEKYNDLTDFDFIEALFSELNFNYELSEKDRLRIPYQGRLVIVSNHPLGGLDGLAILKAISQVRKDVKIVANDILMNLENLKDLFLPYDVYSVKAQRNNIKLINEAFENEEAIAFFPAAQVSRLRFQGIKDRKWQKGAVRFAVKHNAPVLPLFVKGRNSILFYLVSILNSRFGMFMLPHELFRQRDKSIKILTGNPIPPASIQNNQLHSRIKTNMLRRYVYKMYKGHIANPKVQTNLLKKHIYRISRHKDGVFYTEKTVIQPIPVKFVESELKNSELLGYTNDGKSIYLVDYENSKFVLKEISRLREITFRSVGEGTGKASDFDRFDIHYKHIVLWDEGNKDIVGSYRLGITKDIIQKFGRDGLYNSVQFDFNESFNDVLQQSVELGRSFIQKKYWRSSALDYIWQGIGAFLNKYKDIRYLWGAVSISDTYNDLAKSMIVYYYQKWYLGDTSMATPKKDFYISPHFIPHLEEIFTGENHLKDFKILKQSLRKEGVSVPVLYRRYTDLCNYGGVKFISFSVDEQFSNAIDGLILVDLTQLRDDIFKRYYSNQKSLRKKDEVKS